MSNNNTLTYNFNELIVAKQQLKSIIQEGGLEPGDVFAQYPGYIASIIDGGGTSTYVINDCIAYYLDTYNYIDLESLESMSYATQSYVADYVATYGGGSDIDLSSYVTHDELNSASYASTSYVADYVATYAPVPDLSAYVTEQELSSCGYITIADVPTIDTSSYVTDTQLQSYLSSYVTDTQLQSYLSSYVTYTYLSENYPTYSYVESKISTSGVQSDWDESSSSSNAFIKNKPAIKAGRGINSIIEGNDAYASGHYSHAEGRYTYTLGNYSHAEGYKTVSYGDYSHAEGDYTYALGIASHAEGVGTYAIGNYSHAEGRHTYAYNTDEHAEGKYNKSNTNTIHSIGIGSSDDRKNAFEVMQNGDVYLYGVGNYNGTNISQASTLAYVINNISGSIDLSSYVTFTYLGNQDYINENDALQLIDSYNIVSKNRYNSIYVTGRDLDSFSGSYGNNLGYGTGIKNFAETAIGKYNYSINGTIFSVGIGYSHDNNLSDDIAETYNALAVLDNGQIYAYGIGDYTGRSVTFKKSIQDILEDTITINYLNNASYASTSYVANYVATYAPTPDLSSYVTYNYLSNQSYITSIPSEYITETELSNASYASTSYVADYVATYAPTPDLSNYPTYSYVADNYPTYAYSYSEYVNYTYLGDLTEITEYILGSGSSSAPENVYATKLELGAYVSKISLESMSYITMDDIDACGYITANDISIPVINENLIPKENNTYTLGDSSHLYTATYSSNIYLSNSNGWENVSNWQTRFKLDGSTKYYFTSNRFYPGNNESASLGLSNQRFLDTYTANLYTNTAYLQDTSYTKSIVPAEDNTYTLGDESHLYSATYSSRLKVGNNSQIYNDGGGITFSVNSNNGVRIGSTNLYPKTSGAFSLGQSSNKWAATYTTNLYADTAYLQDTSYVHNLIPAEDNTYTLGDESHLYDTTYTSNVFIGTYHSFRKNGNSNQSFYVNINGNNRYVFSNSGFFPAATNRTLGQDTSTGKWLSTYSSNIYADTAYLQDTSYSSSVIPKSTDTYTLGDSSNYYHTLYSNRLQGNSSVNIRTGGNNRLTITGTAMRPMNQNYNLGSSDYPFATAYISNIHNFIWTGTSGEYAALDNYTSYQIYMIKES